MISIGRSSWLGYRWQRHCLGENCDSEDLDDLLLLGMQGSRQSGGEHPLSQRTSHIGNTLLANAIRPEGPVVTMWSVRGAPHAHRARQLDIIRDALAPLDTDEGGRPYVDAVAEVAAALQHVVQGPTPKGDASGAMVGAVSQSLVKKCASCGAPHVPDDIFRAAGRQAQLVIGPPENGATMLHPPPQIEQDHIKEPRLAFLQAYFRVNGPTSWALFRDWMAAGTPATQQLWEEMGENLVRVTVDNKRYDLPESLVAEVQEAPAAKGVALVPPNDPYLRQVDRGLLLPEAARRRKVYRALSAPGAVLVDGEIAGTWRYHRSERKVIAEPFDRLTQSQRAAVEQRATALATSTGDEAPTITFS